MDTSDSECFESADEEIYLEEDIKKSAQKYDKIVNEAQKDLMNLNIVDSSKKTLEREVSNTSDSVNNALNANKNPTQFVLNKKHNIDVTSPNIEETISTEIVLTDTGGITTKSATRQIDIDNTKCKETDNLSITDNLDGRNKSETLARNNNDAVIIENDTVEITNVNEKQLSNITQKNELINLVTKQEKGSSKTKLVEESENDEQKAVESIKKKEEISLDNNKKKNNDVLKKEPDLEETLEVSNNDENMWENDEWEPISYEKDHKLSRNKDKPKVEENEENMWDNDEWEPFEKVDSQKISQPTEPAWSSWGNWGGVSSILTTATQGVTSLTSQVSQGFSNVLETGMGIPDPKELAKIDRELEKEQNHEDPSSKTNIGFGFSNLSNLVSGVSHITKFVENTGSKVITGGLDTLETIGKKTMEVLQEGDPGLKNKRALLKLEKDKPILSQVLREAKEKAERENKKLQETHSKKKMNYETLFDDFHGLVHLEALEMLSKQCDIKLETLGENCSRDEFQDLQETMDQIKELCELPDEDDDETPTIDDIKEKLETAVRDINVTITYAKLISLWEDTDIWLKNLKLEFCNEDEIHQEALQVLAQLTAIAVEQFHKCGELLLIKEHRSTADEADSLVQLTTTLTSLIGLVAGRFSEKLNIKSSQTGNKESVNELITNVFFEAGNSSSYIQDAFQLLVPVLQVGAV